MARFNFIHYLFAIFVVLAMVAHARPASSDPDTDTVAGMPGMSKKPGVAMSGEDKKDSTPEADSEEEYMEDMKEAISAAAKAASKATPTSAGPRPTPGVATGVATTTATPTAASKPSGSAKPSQSAAPAKHNMLESIPLLGPMLGGLA